MKRVLAALALTVLAAVPARAADIKNIDLGKNAQVWFAEDHTVPIISFNISMPAGSAYDPPGKAGLASFAASMIDEGAGPLDSKAFHEALADRAIIFNASTQRDFMVISITTLKENAPEAMHLLQLALTRPRFDGEALTRVRAQIIQALQQDEVEPQRVASRGFMRAFFGGHAYAHPVNGEVGSISSVTTGDLRNFVRSHWTRHGLKIAVAGDITEPALAKLLGQTFQPVSDATPQPLPNVGRLGEPGVHVIPLPVPQPNIYFGLPGIMRADPDFIPGYIANYILGGGGFSSRLTDEVRVKRGLTYGISTSLTPYKKASVLLGAVATRADAVRQTIQVVKDTMADFAANGPTQQELDDAKTYLTGSFPLSFDSNATTAAQLGTFEREDLDIGYVAHRNSLIQAVTLADVQRVSKKLFDPARLTVVVSGSPVDGHGVAQVPRPPVRPAPLPPGAPTAQPGHAPITGPGANVPGVMPPSKPADKPLPGPVTQPKAAKKP